MKGRHHTAVGIDIGPSRVQMVVLKRTKKKVIVRTTAQCPLPEGVVENGQLLEMETLVRILGKLKGQCKVSAYTPVGLSVHGLPSVLQIVKIPKQIPSNVSQFVSQEIKQCVTLTGREVITDYSNVGGSQRVVSQVLGVGGDEKSIRQFIQVGHQAHLSIDWVEPPQLGFIRSLYENRIAPCVNRNLMLLMLRGSLLQLAVFRGGSLDFIRERELGNEGQDEAQLKKRLIQDIDALIQFYEIEISPNGCQWDIVLMMDQDPSIQSALAATLSDSYPDAQIQSLDDTMIHSMATAEISDKMSLSDISWTALGTALHGMREANQPLQVNLMPHDISKAKQVKRQGLMTTCAAAVVLAVMAMVGYGMGIRTAQVQDEIRAVNVAQDRDETIEMVGQRKSLEHKIELLKQANKQLKQIEKTREQIDWSALLMDIRRLMPESLWLNKMEVKDQEHALIMTGGSMTWRAVNLFASQLIDSPYIVGAKVVRSDQKDEQGRIYVHYQIRCQLKGEREGSS